MSDTSQRWRVEPQLDTEEAKALRDTLTAHVEKFVKSHRDFQEHILAYTTAAHGLDGLHVQRYETPYGEDFCVFKQGSLVALVPFVTRPHLQSFDATPSPARYARPVTPMERPLLDEYHKVMDALRGALEDAKRLQEERDRYAARVKLLEQRLNSIREAAR